MGLKYDDLIPEERQDVQKVRGVDTLFPPARAIVDVRCVIHEGVRKIKRERVVRSSVSAACSDTAIHPPSQSPEGSMGDTGRGEGFSATTQARLIALRSGPAVLDSHHRDCGQGGRGEDDVGLDDGGEAEEEIAGCEDATRLYDLTRL